jgi:hypothetical protein
MNAKFLSILFAIVLPATIIFAQNNRILSFKEAKELADKGDPYGEAVVAFHYSIGWQTDKNLDLAAKYAMSSARKNHPLGIFRLGALRRAGEGAEKNEDQGLALQKNSFNGLNKMSGNPYAITALGVMLFQGKVVPENKKEAARLYKIAADMGFAPAQFNFAMCAEVGHGTPQSELTSIEYLTKAIEYDYPLALNHLQGLDGRDFRLEGVRQDVLMAQAALTAYAAFLNTEPFLATLAKVSNFRASGGKWPTPEERDIAYNVQLVEAVKEEGDRFSRLQKSLNDCKTPAMTTRDQTLRARAEMFQLLSQIFERIPFSASSGYSPEGFYSFADFTFPTESGLINWKRKSPLFHEAYMLARTRFAYAKLKQVPELADLGEIILFQESIEKFLSNLPCDANVDARLKLIGSWLFALEGFFAFALDKTVVHLNYNNKVAEAKVAIPFSASCGRILSSQRRVTIGGEKGEVAIFDLDTGGEIWRGNLPGKVDQIFELDGNLYAQTRPQGTLEWGFPAYLWMVDWREGKMTRLPVGLDDLSDNARQKIRFVGDIPATGELVFFDYSSSYALYALSPSSEKVRLLAPLHSLLSIDAASLEQPTNEFLTTLLSLGGDARRERWSDVIDPKRLLTTARCKALGIREVPKSESIDESTIPGHMIFDSCPSLSLALVSNQKQENLVGDSTFDEYSGGAVPQLLSRNSNSLGVVDRLRFTQNQKLTVSDPPYFFKSWLREANKNSGSKFLPRFSDFLQPTVAVHHKLTGTFNYLSSKDRLRNCWLAAKGDTVVGNFDGHITGEANNEVFVGEVFDSADVAPEADILTLADGRKIKAEPVARVEAAISDLRPLSMGVLEAGLCFFSTPQGLIYCRQKSGRWSDSPPAMPPGCFSGLKHFRESANGEWLLADASGWTHILEQGESEPLRSPFRLRFKNKDSYIALTDDRYFIASGDQLRDIFFSYKDRAYPFEQFDLRLNRPDIVLERLGAPEEATAIAKQLREKRLKRMGVTEDMLQPDFHLPEIEIVGDLPSSTGESQLALKIKASDSKYPLDRLRLYVNNVPVNGKEGELLRDAKSPTLQRTIPIKLAAGRNKIQVSVLNSAGAESLYANAEVTCTAQRPKPNLYAVAIGISEYANPEWNLKYAAKDARDILERVKARSGSSYGEIKELLLTNRDATKESLGKIREFLSKATVDDTVLMFVAGHGLLDSKYDYYFGTADIDFNNPSGKGIAFEELDDLLAELPCVRKSLLIDTCHAGELDEEEKKMLASAQANPNKVVAMLPAGARGMNIKPIEGARGKSEWYDRLQGLFVDLRRGSGSTILSSSAGAEYALESSEQKNGIFTYAVLEALDGKEGVDANKDSSVTMSELADYVKTRVAALTNNKQSPNVRRVNLEADFALSKK